MLLEFFARHYLISPAGSKSSTAPFYNKMKSAMDDIDKKVQIYSTERKCRLWPYPFLMNLLDVAGVNATIFY